MEFLLVKDYKVIQRLHLVRRQGKFGGIDVQTTTNVMSSGLSVGPSVGVYVGNR
jgi:hypothetical protein